MKFYKNYWVAVFAVISILSLVSPQAFSEEEEERQPITISVVVENPSSEKDHTFPVKIDLPAEIEPRHVIEQGELTIEYDDRRSIYFLYNPNVELKPKEKKVFNVLIKDVWVIPKKEMEPLRAQTEVVLSRLEGTRYYDAGKELANSIFKALDDIVAKQNDDSLSQKRRIGVYRTNLDLIAEVKEDILQMEKLLKFIGGVPVPDMLEESKIKSDAPSTKTTWLIIITIMVFLGLLGAQFYYTWSKKASAEKDFFEGQKEVFPGTFGDDDKKKG